MQIPYQNVQQPAASAAQSVTQPITVKDSIPAANVKTSQQADTVEFSTKENKTKQGPIKSIKNGIANIKKFFATTGSYVKGTFNGIKNGAVAGSLIYTGGSILKKFKPESKVPHKALAIVAAGVALAGSLWNASLDATEKNSNIDHRWTGHNK